MNDDDFKELERTRVELELLRNVVNRIPAMLAYWDSSQRCVFANQAYERWFGVTPAWLIGRTMKELLGPIYLLNLPFIEGALRGEAQAFEREIPTPEGGPPRHGQAHYLPHVDDGVVRGFYVLVSDVSERKAMEDALRVAHHSAQAALAKLKALKGLLPICAWCHRIRDESGHWETLEKYLSEHSNLTVTHGMCEACAASSFP